MAAQTGATTRELMARLGHSSPRAALIYQHATAERDHTIAAGLDAIIEAANSTRSARIVPLAARRKGAAEGTPGAVGHV
jgi:hypothetical protein